MPCEMYPYFKVLSFMVSLPVNSSQSLSYRKQQQILLSAAEGNLPGRTEDNIVLRQKQQPVPVSRSPFCFEEKPKPLLCQTPSRWLFIATTQRLQSCQEGVSPRPDTCFSQLSQFVCDHFKNLFLFWFSSCSLFGWPPQSFPAAASLAQLCPSPSAGSSLLASLVSRDITCIFMDVILLKHHPSM